MPKDIVSTDGTTCLSCASKVGKGYLRCKQRGSMYCSAQCREAQSYWHDPLCLSLRSLSKKKDGWRRALFFPVDRNYPRFTWGDISKDYGIQVLDNTKPQLRHFTGDPPTSGRMQIRNIKGSLFRHDNPHYDLFFTHRGRLDVEKFPTNKSVATFVQQGRLQYCWRGPVEIRKKGGSFGRTVADMEMQDVRNVIEILRVLGQYSHEDDTGPGSIWAQSHALGLQATQGRQVLCTKINSEEDVDKFLVERYVRLHLPGDLPAMKTAKPLQLSEQLGLPLLMWRYPSAFPYDNLDPGKQCHKNLKAGYLLLGTDPEDPTWPDDELWQYPSTVVVMRKDGKDLDPRQTEVLCEYCKGIVEYAGDFMGSGRESLSRTQLVGVRSVLDTYTKTGYEKYFDWYRKDRSRADPSWLETTSPYKV